MPQSALATAVSGPRGDDLLGVPRGATPHERMMTRHVDALESEEVVPLTEEGLREAAGEVGAVPCFTCTAPQLGRASVPRVQSSCVVASDAAGNWRRKGTCH